MQNKPKFVAKLAYLCKRRGGRLATADRISPTDQDGALGGLRRFRYRSSCSSPVIKWSSRDRDAVALTSTTNSLIGKYPAPAAAWVRDIGVIFEPIGCKTLANFNDADHAERGALGRTQGSNAGGSDHMDAPCQLSADIIPDCEPRRTGVVRGRAIRGEMTFVLRTFGKLAWLARMAVTPRCREMDCC